MKIYFLGLSSFLIENNNGYRILVDPYDDSDRYTLGIKFPKEIDNSPLGANVLLISEPDPDHASIPDNLLINAKPTEPNSNPFPGLDLKGTIVYEYNGDINICYHYTIDGIRVAHFADHANLLSQQQILELGKLDIIFISPPKCDFYKNPNTLNQLLEDIEKLNPKIVIFSHHIVPIDIPKTSNKKLLRNYFATFFANNAKSNIGYEDRNSFIELSYVYENAHFVGNKFNDFEILNSNVFEINKEELDILKNKKVILFNKMLGLSNY